MRDQISLQMQKYQQFNQSQNKVRYSSFALYQSSPRDGTKGIKAIYEKWRKKQSVYEIDHGRNCATQLSHLPSEQAMLDVSQGS